MTHTEFSTAVTVWALEKPDYEPCSELLKICQLLDAPELSRSPVELYPSLEPVRSVSTGDPTSYLNIDMVRDPTDQMDVVKINIRCSNEVADAVEELLRQIRTRSDVTTAMLRGNLGLPDVGSEP